MGFRGFSEFNNYLASDVGDSLMEKTLSWPKSSRVGTTQGATSWMQKLVINQAMLGGA